MCCRFEKNIHPDLRTGKIATRSLFLFGQLISSIGELLIHCAIAAFLGIN